MSSAIDALSPLTGNRCFTEPQSNSHAGLESGTHADFQVGTLLFADTEEQ